MKNIILSLLTIGLLANCASVVSFTDKPISVTSNPTNVNVKVVDSNNNIVLTNTTPFDTNLKKGKKYFTGEDYTFMFSKEGYEDLSLTLKTELNSWYFGNVLLGGPIGLLLIDPLTGNMWKFDKNNVHGELIKK